MIIIYHSRDMDGYSSGAICKRKFPDAILVGFDYGQNIYEKLEKIKPAFSSATAPLCVVQKEHAYLSEHNVIMIDVSLKMPQMFELAGKCKSLTYIDHHKSAIEEFEAVKDQAPTNFIPVLENGIAACEVGWKYLFPNEKMPEAIHILGEYDTWRNQDKDRWENVILPFQFGMRLKCHSPQTFPMHLLDKFHSAQDTGIENIIVTGKIILEYQANMNRAACGRAFEFEFEGLRAICLNGGGFNSDVFKSVYDPEKHDIMMPFQFDGKNKQWVFSMYSTKPEIDVSVIAKKWGGGGHMGAAGFQIKGDLGLVFTFLNEKNSEEFVVKRVSDGQISCEVEGNIGDVAVMLCQAMIGSVEVASMVLGAVPSYLDKTNTSREGYCKTVMNAVGAKEKGE